jgi:hypothetical protein
VNRLTGNSSQSGGVLRTKGTIRLGDLDPIADGQRSWFPTLTVVSGGHLGGEGRLRLKWEQVQIKGIPIAASVQ